MMETGSSVGRGDKFCTSNNYTNGTSDVMNEDETSSSHLQVKPANVNKDNTSSPRRHHHHHSSHHHSSNKKKSNNVNKNGKNNSDQ